MDESSDYKQKSEYKKLIIQHNSLEIIPRSESVTDIILKRNFQRPLNSSNLNFFISSLNENGEMLHHAFIPFFIQKLNNRYQNIFRNYDNSKIKETKIKQIVNLFKFHLMI